MSVINRVRFTAWAWLASAFLLGTATGVFAAGVPLWSQLQAARNDAARLEQVENLIRHVEPGADAETLVSLEEQPRASALLPTSALPAPAPQQRMPDPAPVFAQQVTSAQVAAKVTAPAPEAALAAPQTAPIATPAVPAAAAQPPGAPPRGPSDAERKTADARKAAQAAEDAERRAKAERQAKLDREQKLAKAAQEAQLKKDREREQAEARAAAARAKPVIEAPVRREPLVQLAAPVPAAGTNAPTERVTKDEAGLAEVQAGSVTFKSGRRVAVGDSFPSGEKLISVDPGIGEIITSKRRIVIKATPQVAPPQ
ncbi:hypothetical protein LJR175_008346 [Variovorax sp. LjRoot175]|uniref:hypothetical protein n=1 Tax=Variovorax sp. LjRoot175 TaxID=3342276 RepID=UPI003ECC9069